MGDKEIIQLLRQNPAEGLREVIHQYNALVKTVIARVLLYHQQDVEECASDTFISIWKNIQRLDENSNLKGYILCTARNTAINRYHLLKRQTTMPLEDYMDISAEEDVEASVLLWEDSSVLLDELAKLEDEDRTIMLRKHFLFESVGDIATATNKTPTQVKNRLYRLKQILKVQLTKRGVSV